MNNENDEFYEWEQKETYKVGPKEIITDLKFRELIDRLSEIINLNKSKYLYLCGVTDSGKIVAIWLRDRVKLINISCEDFENEKDKSKVLIIDSITKTGENLYFAAAHLSECDTAVLYYNPDSTEVPTYFAEKSKNSIVWPWNWEKSDEAQT